MAKLKKCTLYIKGMHCPSCEILITDKFKEMPNVTTVNSNFQKQEAEVYFTGDLDKETVNKNIRQFGYEISNPPSSRQGRDFGEAKKNIIEAIFIAVGLELIYLIAKELNIIPDINITGRL